jgi:hypothetical protein
LADERIGKGPKHQKMERGRLTRAEDKQIIKAVEKHRIPAWGIIAIEKGRTRTAPQVRERWGHHQMPTLELECTPAEESRLRESVDHFGHKWAKSVQCLATNLMFPFAIDINPQK